ncbi:membrane protein-like protein [Halothiobacillus neapolitanus]|uniref:Membrane protein-like protein n=1 Tax=Halothiobacillus neapolitanus (strain ATCC 23641 / DSM 15147 / CIP 104769 / NCIMB 8539 / c2) TaxID=555778 RepID=D0KW03_HALNC|nr:membrane protein-like protein [Halothiobacillus neapolitanus]ACX94930.1 membrane protein-like protein [Halothiobacillus neapolitanus c2]TDN60423.1 putative membrane protein [Halothiobacillus neapolitanus]
MSRAGLLSRVKAGLILFLLGLDLFLANILSPKAHVSAAVVVLAFLPITLIMLDVLWHTAGKAVALAVAALIVLGGVLLLPQLQAQISLIYLLQHLTANLLLGFWFGRSLWRNRQPVCTQFAGVLHPRMTPLLVQYTTRVTQAWTIFFFAMATTSILLYLFAPITLWSIFANSLTLPLLVLMFGAEYLVRRRVLPPEDQLGPLSAFRAYRRSVLARLAQGRHSNVNPDTPTSK